VIPPVDQQVHFLHIDQEGRVASRPYPLRDSRGRTNGVRGRAQDGIPASASSGTPGHGRIVGNPGPGERGVRRSEGPSQAVHVRRSTAPGHRHGAACICSLPPTTDAGQQSSGATTRATIWSIRRSRFGYKRPTCNQRRASLPLRPSSPVGSRRGTGPPSATQSAVARHLRVGTSRTAPKSRTAAETGTAP